ncbi:MAG: hypothetical protein ACK5KR_05730 [Breznakia sp.]
MKKIWMVCFLLFGLSACFDNSKTLTCKLKKNNKETIVTATYEDGIISDMKYTMITTLDKETLSLVGDKEDVEESLRKSVKVFEEKGVVVDASYDNKKHKSKLVINIDINEIDIDSYAKYAIPADKGIGKLVKSYEIQEFDCKKIK